MVSEQLLAVHKVLIKTLAASCRMIFKLRRVVQFTLRALTFKAHFEPSHNSLMLLTSLVMRYTIYVSFRPIAVDMLAISTSLIDSLYLI